LRKTSIYNKLEGIDKDWIGIQTLIKVERYVKTKKKTRKEIAFYISSLKEKKAKIYHDGIRKHWSIENSLHYVKDKTFKEDACKVTTDNGATNLSLIRNIIINLFRREGFNNMAQAIRLICNDVNKMWNIIIE
jgi:predicted transposase YbfD/YdcC